MPTAGGQDYKTWEAPGLGGRAGVSKSSYLDYFSSIGKNIYSIFYGERGAKQ